MSQELSKEMETLIELMKKHFKEEAEMDVVATTFATVEELTIIEEGSGSGKYGVMFPIEWKTKDLTGVDLEELAAGLKFVWGYRIKDLLQ